MRNVIRVSSISLLLLIAISRAEAFGVEQEQWQRYRTDNDEFSIALPAVPAMRTQRWWRDDRQRECQARFIGAYADGIVFTTHILENIDGKKLEELLSNPLSQTRPLEPNSEKQLLVSNIVGRQFVMADKTFGGVVQFFATPQRLYQFEAVGAGPEDPRIRKFFESLSFSEKPDGKEIVDGLGEPWKSATTSSEQNMIYTGNDVQRKVFLVAKLVPQYTELARQHRVVGKIVLKAVLSRDGTVEDIQIVSGLPDGMTEEAVYVTKLTKFIPALKDGHFVSTWIQFEYHFDLY